MVGFIAALVAIYLGAAGPAFRWKGASILGFATVTIGALNTVLTAEEAHSQGLHFAVTPGSISGGLVVQLCFMISFYALASLARWSAHQLASDRLKESRANDQS